MLKDFRVIDGKRFRKVRVARTPSEAKKLAKDYRSGKITSKALGKKVSAARVIETKYGYWIYIR